MVSTADGLRPISTIRVGDLVLAYDETSRSTGLFTVTDVLVHLDPAQVHLTIGGEHVETTPEHPFFTQERGWVDAADLWHGAHVRQADGSFDTVWSVLVETEPQVMYNLTVAQANTFFVGAGRWLVHNDICWINFDDLPNAEKAAVQETLGQIEGRIPGPTPGSPKAKHWGIEFKNREGELPPESPAYYSEYRVIPAGQTTAGVLRIVIGDAGEVYYTWTHYGTAGDPPFVRLR